MPIWARRQRLLRECTIIAEALGLDPDLDPHGAEITAALDGDGSGEGWQRYPAESYACLQLLAVARAAVRESAALWFT